MIKLLYVLFIYDENNTVIGKDKVVFGDDVRLNQMLVF